MTTSPGPGARLRALLDADRPVQIAGAVNAGTARLAEAAGFEALYLPGVGVAASSAGRPGAAVTTVAETLVELRRVCEATRLPVLVDADAAARSGFLLARSVRQVIGAGAAALHLSDRLDPGPAPAGRPPAVVPQAALVDRIRRAVDARTDAEVAIVARVEAAAVEGLGAAIERARACVEAGADWIMPEGVMTLLDLRRLAHAVGAPVLASVTEFAPTPLLSVDQLRAAGIAAAVYPLSAFRAMSAAAAAVFRAIRDDGSQQRVIDRMQPQADLLEHFAPQRA